MGERRLYRPVLVLVPVVMVLVGGFWEELGGEDRSRWRAHAHSHSSPVSSCFVESASVLAVALLLSVFRPFVA